MEMVKKNFHRKLRKRKIKKKRNYTREKMSKVKGHEVNKMQYFEKCINFRNKKILFMKKENNKNNFNN